MLAGFRRKVDLQKQLNLEAWRRARLIAFVNIPQTKDKQISMWDFLPLEGDPTPEEIKEMRNERAANRMKSYRELKRKLNNAGV